MLAAGAPRGRGTRTASGPAAPLRWGVCVAAADIEIALWGRGPAGWTAAWSIRPSARGEAGAGDARGCVDLDGVAGFLRGLCAAPRRGDVANALALRRRRALAALAEAVLRDLHSGATAAQARRAAARG